MRWVYGIIFFFVVVWLLGLIVVLTGCGGSGLGGYYEPAPLAGTYGYQQTYNPYQYPQIIQPVNPLNFPRMPQPMQGSHLPSFIP